MTDIYNKLGQYSLLVAYDISNNHPEQLAKYQEACLLIKEVLQHLQSKEIDKLG